MEASCGWVPYWMEQLDEHFEFLQLTVPWLRQPPSEYMKSGQMFYAFEMEEKMLPYVAEFVGAERLVFATDYNHSDSKFPHTVEEVMEKTVQSSGLSERFLIDFIFLELPHEHWFYVQAEFENTDQII